MFTAKDVMELRELTQAGMMDCKKALTECDGDFEKAKDYLREKGLAAAAKKAGRIAAEGIVGGFVDPKTGVGVIVEVNCETDFVAKTDNFKDFVAMVAEQVAQKNPADVDALLAQDCISTPGTTISGMLNEAVLKIGEKISIRRFARYEGVVDCYIHLGGRIGVLTEMDAPANLKDNDTFKTVAHDISMQIAAARPTYLKREDVPAEEVEHEKEINRAMALNEEKPKPAEVIEKMLVGRIEKFYKEVCLLEQLFVKDTSMNITKLLENTSKELGAKITVKRFARFEMGEGLQKRECNFAEEIAAATKH
ncbi:Elongation factor Ts [bioreactor metagenome]|jgi:elongation factor Ts|uniref:Elongation factor Ts n=1 Tax=bioreactor metagenome TaxID=1076179 RepID=A0A644WV90_9ZZZZ|nr:translation elongation factor Ts [Clostridia bacterium]